MDPIWEEGFEHLEEYVQAFGNANVPRNYVSPGEYNLGKWVERQRLLKNTMSRESKDRLEQLSGWLWKPLDSRWEQGFAYLEEFVAANGDARVPIKHITPDGFNLWNWVEKQRASRDTLVAARLDRLKGLKGWTW